MREIYVFCDGGAIKNPGPAAIGMVICDSEGRVLKKISKYIGEATNNQAEYQAVIEALSFIKSNLKSRAPREACSSRVIVYLDSELIVNQLNHRFKIKNKELAPLFLKVHNLVISLGNVKFEYIPREENKEADKLVKKAINARNYQT